MPCDLLCRVEREIVKLKSLLWAQMWLIIINGIKSRDRTEGDFQSAVRRFELQRRYFHIYSHI